MIFTHTYIYSSIKPILHGWPWFHVLQIQKVIWGVFVCYTSRTGPGYSCSSPIDQTNVQILNCKKLCFKKKRHDILLHIHVECVVATVTVRNKIWPGNVLATSSNSVTILRTVRHKVNLWHFLKILPRKIYINFLVIMHTFLLKIKRCQKDKCIAAF